ncbi:hypothetical protein F5Y06DRAFT_297732 [Hypoxylon sp. FL0890]|nr:hypothetical protein F5Y06DRAFT_297732 [Hypoxylon sp. FL0890]
MTEPELPNDKIETAEDAEKLQEVIEGLQDYVDDIEPGKVLAPETKNMLLKIKDRISSVFEGITDAMSKFSNDTKTYELVKSLKDLLFSLVRDIDWILEENNKMEGN